MLNQAFGMTITRIALGIVLFAHGYILKVETFTIGGTVGFFESIGLPAIAAYLVIGGEILGGIALILGAFTRLAAWLSLPILLGATWMHLGNNWVFSAEGGGWEFPILLVALALAVGFGGAGKYAIDNLDWMKNLNLTQSTAQQATA
ncbi:MAG: DoxX family protein [Gammaproteobacteria bacterium]|jgi:putative oxidoreductase|nr:DoxX family protein [Gammaproteobacteria bacterium]NCW08884.1 DoxX family protein [Gammaproteobacteria bacterium]NCW73907.1 DoxX family protein [Gammaproteobacteria bacterium]NCX48166.1 DoxX family protein [Gammaproteobacteria bacterium]